MFFMRLWRLCALRLIVVDVSVDGNPVSLSSPSPDVRPPVLWPELETVDDELSLGGFFSYTVVVVLSVRTTVCGCNAVAGTVVGTMSDVRASGSPATDSFRSALMVADWTFAAYSAAMRSASGPCRLSCAVFSPPDP